VHHHPLSPTQKLCSIRQMLLQAAALVRPWETPSPAVASLVVVTGGRCPAKNHSLLLSSSGAFPRRPLGRSAEQSLRGARQVVSGIPEMFVSLSRLATLSIPGPRDVAGP
jgi:hypothetical protein